VWGKLLPAATSRALGAVGGLPLGLAQDVEVVRPVAAGQSLTWADVRLQDSRALRLRREMERLFAA
jgi:predicted homoserine dehydrogenase-like protein